METVKIPLAKPYASEEVVTAVKDVFKSHQFINGNQTKLFEREFADFIGCKHAVGTSSGTSALHLALLSSGIRERDEVITVSHTFIATLESIWYLRAGARLADIDERYYVMDTSYASSLVTEKTRAIVPVHIFGHPVDMDPIRQLAKERGLVIVEDAAQAHGSKYKGRSIGTLGDAACFSFYPSKNLTVCGDGGMLVTDNDEIAARARMLRDHGRTQKYASDVLGYNYRISEIASAVGRVGLKHLPDWNKERRLVASSYERLLSPCKQILTPKAADWAHHVYHVYAIRSPSRDELIRWLGKNGIQTGVHYPIPCHLQPVFGKMEDAKIKLEKTEQVAKELLSLPMYPGITEEDMAYVASKIREFHETRY